MSDYPKEPLGAQGQKSREPEKRMRVFLGCEKTPYGSAYDFKKGNVKFEYKHSRFILRNKDSPKQQRLHPTKGWSFENLKGHGGNKDYDYLILEGEAEVEGKPSYLFLIGFKEFPESFLKMSHLSVTLPLGGGKSRPLGKNSKFVWDHWVTREELKAKVDRYAQSSEDGESLLRAGISGESDGAAKNVKEYTCMDSNCPNEPKSTRTKAVLQLPLLFMR